MDFDPSIDMLRAFEAAGRRGSYKAAAEELNLTPSAISHRVTRLEQLLGERLFEPHGRGVVLTQSGMRHGCCLATNPAKDDRVFGFVLPPHETEVA